MVEQITLQTLIMLIQAVGILVAVIYHILSLQNTRKNQQLTLETRQTQLFMYLYDKFCSESFKRSYSEIMSWEWVDFDDYSRKYGPFTNPEKDFIRRNIGSFFEGLGVLVKNEQISPELVDDLMSQHIITYWEKFGPIIKEARTILKYPHAAEWVEYLYNQIKPIYDKQHTELAT